jgi:hypothetical protein
MIGVRFSMNAMDNTNESIPDSVIEKIQILEERKVKIQKLIIRITGRTRQ